MLLFHMEYKVLYFIILLFVCNWKLVEESAPEDAEEKEKYSKTKNSSSDENGSTSCSLTNPNPSCSYSYDSISSHESEQNNGNGSMKRRRCDTDTLRISKGYGEQENLKEQDVKKLESVKNKRLITQIQLEKKTDRSDSLVTQSTGEYKLLVKSLNDKPVQRESVIKRTLNTRILGKNAISTNNNFDINDSVYFQNDNDKTGSGDMDRDAIFYINMFDPKLLSDTPVPVQVPAAAAAVVEVEKEKIQLRGSTKVNSAFFEKKCDHTYAKEMKDPFIGIQSSINKKTDGLHIIKSCIPMTNSDSTNNTRNLQVNLSSNAFQESRQRGRKAKEKKKNTEQVFDKMSLNYYCLSENGSYSIDFVYNPKFSPTLDIVFATVERELIDLIPGMNLLKILNDTNNVIDIRRCLESCMSSLKRFCYLCSQMKIYASNSSNILCFDIVYNNSSQLLKYMPFSSLMGNVKSKVFFQLLDSFTLFQLYFHLVLSSVNLAYEEEKTSVYSYMQKLKLVLLNFKSRPHEFMKSAKQRLIYIKDINSYGVNYHMKLLMHSLKYVLMTNTELTDNRLLRYANYTSSAEDIKKNTDLLYKIFDEFYQRLLTNKNQYQWKITEQDIRLLNDISGCINDLLFDISTAQNVLKLELTKAVESLLIDEEGANSDKKQILILFSLMTNFFLSSLLSHSLNLEVYVKYMKWYFHFLNICKRLLNVDTMNIYKLLRIFDLNGEISNGNIGVVVHMIMLYCKYNVLGVITSNLFELIEELQQRVRMTINFNIKVEGIIYINMIIFVAHVKNILKFILHFIQLFEKETKKVEAILKFYKFIFELHNQINDNMKLIEKDIWHDEKHLFEESFTDNKDFTSLLSLYFTLHDILEKILELEPTLADDHSLS